MIKITCSHCKRVLEPNRIGKRMGLCKSCQAVWQRAYRKTHPLSEKEKQKMKARSLALNALRQGKLNRLPCEVCKNGDTEFHHDDYSKPLEVRHLCRACHLEWHNKKKLEDVG